MTATITSTPPLFILEIGSSQYRGYGMGALACASVFGVICLPEYRCHETLGIPHARDPIPLLPC